MITENMRGLIKNGATIRAMFEEGKELARKYGKENVYDFSLGNPNVETPEEIKKLICEIVSEEDSLNLHGYMSNSGYEDVRKTIANSINKKYELNIDEQSIVMTCGAAGGLNIIFKSILEEGDEVIVFAPLFGEYSNYIKNFKGKEVIASTEENTFLPDVEDLKRNITERTKAVIINSPNNPTGVIYSSKVIEDICFVLKQKQLEYNNDIYLIADEPYRELVYDDTDVPYIFNYYDNSFVCYSYSKSLSLPGERIGYVAINNNMNDFEEMTAALSIANRILGFVNAPSLFQKVIKKSLNLEVDVNIYKRNRDLIYNHLIHLGIKCEKPQGAFYLFPKCPIEDDKKFCEEAKKFNILLVPGSVFKKPGYFRLAYCVSYETIVNSLPAFSKLMEQYRL